MHGAIVQLAYSKVNTLIIKNDQDNLDKLSLIPNPIPNTIYANLIVSLSLSSYLTQTLLCPPNPTHNNHNSNPKY